MRGWRSGKACETIIDDQHFCMVEVKKKKKMMMMMMCVFTISH